jgi:hypothetical protein
MVRAAMGSRLEARSADRFEQFTNQASGFSGGF